MKCSVNSPQARTPMIHLSRLAWAAHLDRALSIRTLRNLRRLKTKAVTAKGQGAFYSEKPLKVSKREEELPPCRALWVLFPESALIYHVNALGTEWSPANAHSRKTALNE